MNLTTTFVKITGESVRVEYQEGNVNSPRENLEGKILQGVHAFCILKSSNPETHGKLILVHHPKHGWMPAGGGIDDEESYEEAIIREVKEETNMKVLHQELIGFQDIYELARTVRQVRSFCIVEPYGTFEADPDGEIQEIKLIDSSEYKQYFDWGLVGDRIMKRVNEMSESFLNKI
ncbi:MAG: NUDIX hydrolase [Candidatus Pacebacteria bacterium]|nr:NUDIX hydrolase [Candidatus Paceibacterota bacterium]